MLRRISPTVLLALAIGAGAATLNVLLARQLNQIEQDASAIVNGWIARSATLAKFEDGVSEYRRHEALYALGATAAEQQPHASLIDSLRIHNDSTLSQLRNLDRRATDSSATIALREHWTAYRELHTQDRGIPGGSGSPSLQRFRDREPIFQGMIALARQAQDSMRAGAEGIALRSQRSSRASLGLLIARLLLVLAAIVLAESLRRNRKRRTEAEQRWRDVADQSVGVIWEVGPSGRLRFCSRSGYELMGLDAGRVTGTHALRYVHASDRRLALRLATDAAPTLSPLRDLEVRVVRPDGGIRWLAISAQPLRTHDGRYDGFRGMAVDITRRAQAEQALAQGRRMEAVGTLAGGVAHDLNNVLAAVSGYAQLAQLELPRDHPSQSDLASITSAADRGALLVRRVLQFARQRPTQRQPVEIAELTHEVTQLLRPQLPQHVKVLIDLPNTELYVLADPTELHQVVVNIAANAIHAMRERETTLGFAIESNEQDVMLTVSDDGIGMPNTVLERAIEPFFTTRAVGEGTGMGLAVAHGVVASLGGTLQIESVIGTGTRVTVTLPRAHAQTPDVQQPARLPGVSGTLRVMVVDDDPHVRNAMTRFLERSGHIVEAFAAATAALTALRLDPSRADVVLTDLTMPVMNGLEFASSLQHLAGAPPVVMSSGYLDLATSAHARAVGIVALLDKPIDPAGLLAALSNAAPSLRA
jgi:PAS domain S-box-containing protein